MNEVWNGPVAIIGAGQIGSALMAGLLRAGYEPGNVRVATRNPAHAEKLAAAHGVRAANLSAALDGATLVAVATRPAQVTAVLDEMAGQLTADAVVLSLAGAPDHATLAKHLPGGTPVVRAITNPAMAVGAGLAGFCPAPECPPHVAERVRGLLGRIGRVIDVVEPQLDAIGPLAGHGQAASLYVADAVLAWGVQQGFSRAESREIVAAAFAGVAAQLAEPDSFPEDLQHRLCTPGGTTIRSMAELDVRGVRGAVIASMDGGSFAQR